MSPSIGWWRQAELSRTVDVPSGGEIALHLDTDPLAAADGVVPAALRVLAVLDGAPVSGASLVASVPADDDRTRDFVVGTTDIAGALVRDGVRRTPFGLGLEVDGLGWSRTVEPGPAGDVDVSFVATTGSLAVAVLGYDGLPAVDHEVALAGAPDAGGLVHAYAMTGPDGVARLRAPVGSSYTLRVDGDRGRRHLAGIAVAADNARLEVALSTAGVLAGRVLAATGPRIERIFAVAADRSSFCSVPVREDGSFVITGLDAGTFALELGAGRERFAASPAEVDVGAEGRVGVLLSVGDRQR
ncbi:MAG: hypothetical protein IPM29_19620 [Planctomycetes bacterium]|nr:hypothetical protein [Planctomycetota bacterium]